jgi:hypothetical protein
MYKRYEIKTEISYWEPKFYLHIEFSDELLFTTNLIVTFIGFVIFISLYTFFTIFSDFLTIAISINFVQII